MNDSSDRSGDPGPDDAPEAPPGLASRPSPARLALIGVAIVSALALIVVGVISYQTSRLHKKAVEQQEQERVVRDAVKEAETLVNAREARKAHRNIMNTSPSGAAPVAEPPADVAEKAPVESAAAESPIAEAPAAQVSPPKTRAATPETAPLPAPVVARSAISPARKKSPESSGNCNLKGGSAEEYGKALGRCLEEFNRREGRKEG